MRKDPVRRAPSTETSSKPAEDKSAEMIPSVASLMSSFKQKKKKPKSFVEIHQDQPDGYEGYLINQPDYNKQEPKDFLLIGKVQKRNTRPLTVGELMNRDRGVVVSKLESEIKNLQKLKEYDQSLKDQFREKDNDFEMDPMLTAGKKVGPMRQALKEMKRRLTAF